MGIVLERKGQMYNGRHEIKELCLPWDKRWNHFFTFAEIVAHNIVAVLGDAIVVLDRPHNLENLISAKLCKLILFL